MPRTKQVKKKSSVMRKNQSIVRANVNSNFSSARIDDATTALLSKTYTSLDHFKKEFQTYYDNKVEVRRQGYERACEEVRRMISDILQKFPQSVQKLKTTATVEEDLLLRDQNQDPNVPVVHHSRSRKPVESFEFKKPRTPSVSSNHSLGRRNSSRKRSASTSSAPAPKPDGFKTPVMSSRKFQPVSVITPKIYSDTPMAMMRRPLQGEVAVSMSGSPLMVGAISREDIPTVNVPLHDGRIFSIMPERGAALYDLPDLDDTTKQYLKTLREHLEMLAPNTP